MCPDCVRLRRAQNKFFSGVQQQNQQVMPTGKATLIESKQDSKQPAFGTLPAQSGQQQKVTFANGTLPNMSSIQQSTLPATTTHSSKPHHHSHHDLIQHNEKLQHKQKVQPMLAQSPPNKSQQRTTSPYSIRLGA